MIILSMRNVIDECVTHLAARHVFCEQPKNASLGLGKTVFEKLAAADAINATRALREVLQRGSDAEVYAAVKAKNEAAERFRMAFDIEWPF